MEKRKLYSKLSEEDKFLLNKLKVPYPKHEEQRLLTLRQSKIIKIEDKLNSVYEDFESFTNLASVLFETPFAHLSLIEVDQVYFLSRFGEIYTKYQSRNNSIESFLTCLPNDLAAKYSNKIHYSKECNEDLSEIPPHMIIPDCSQEPKFSSMPYIRDNKIKFFASIAIVVNGMVLGAITIMDTKPRYNGLKESSLIDFQENIEDEDADLDWLNFVDLSVVASQLINDKLQAAIATDSQIASFVVNMMHDLRTPLTSIHYAIPLLTNDLKSMKFENLDNTDSEFDSSISKTASTNNFESVMRCFEMSYNEIDSALYDLTSLVDVGEIWAQIIVKYAQYLKESNCNNNGYVENTESVECVINNFSEKSNINDIKTAENEIFSSTIPSILPRVNMIDYLNDVFLNKIDLKKSKFPLEIKWIIDTSFFSKGIHLTFADIIFAIIISAISKVTNLAKDLTFVIFYHPTESSKHYIEGNIVLKIYSKTMEFIEPTNFSNHIGSTKFLNMLNESKNTSKDMKEPGVNSSNEITQKDMNSDNFLNVNSILSATNVFCKEYDEDIQNWFNEKYNLIDWKKNPFNIHFSELDTSTIGKNKRIVEYLIPCTVLLDESKIKEENIQDFLYFKNYTSTLDSLSTFDVELIPSITSTSDDNNIELIPLNSQSNEFEKLKSDFINERIYSTIISEKAEKDLKQEVFVDSIPEMNKKNSQESLKILIVEDVDSVRKLLARWLTCQGCIVDCAINGEDGLNQLKSNEYDIALVDFLMPVMCGVDLMKSFQKWIQNKNDALLASEDESYDHNNIKQMNSKTLLIGMSANALDHNLIEAFSYGMSFFCFKPCDLTMLSLILKLKSQMDNNTQLIYRVIQESAHEIMNDKEREIEQKPQYTLPSNFRCIALGQSQMTIAQLPI